MEHKKYIHYGHKHFDREMFQNIRNIPIFTKPDGGLWASAVDAEYGWKRWCEENNFRECNMENSFTFTLSQNARVITILSVAGAKALPKQETELSAVEWVFVDFEKLAEQGWDAIEVKISNDMRLYWALYGWDCDSILIMNPDVVVEVEE